MCHLLHCRVFVTAHSLGFWGFWLVQGTWWHEALSNGPRLSNLFGGISFIGGLALWLTSLDAVKRVNYSVFYAMHHIGFWCVVPCLIMIGWQLWMCRRPPLLNALHGVRAFYHFTTLLQAPHMKCCKTSNVCC